ncbi:TPA: hypothetical protein N0F65_007234 [Lagenidium giganteum]|uniref:Uncharacterized protein n=1 Tax=Lagenidium giganteum TaxID=4803 RepID=A0AAV2Z928_9STRA|nr:TPA: hypothetical protein N0F65_007234 [Lagenidium giganteum]
MAKGGSGSGGKANNAREMRMFLQHRMWREHSYVLVAVGVIIVALFGSAFLQFSTSKEHVYRLEVTDTAMMERVFRSGEPWVVLCSRPDDVVSDVFGKVSKRLVDKSSVGVLDCTQTLPGSGKTVLDRFGIKPSISPTVFTVANGERPKQVFLNHLQSSKALARQVVEQTKKTAKELLTTQQLESHCLNKNSCVLFLRGNKWSTYEKRWLDQLLQSHRLTPFVWADATIFKLSTEKALELPGYKRGEHRLVLFKRTKTGNGKDKGELTALAFRGPVFDQIPVAQFLDMHAGNSEEVLSPVAKSPTLVRRKKKTAAAATNADTEPELPPRRRRKPRPTEEEEDDAYYFPQQVDPEDAAQEQEQPQHNDLEVLDLDDD